MSKMQKMLSKFQNHDFSQVFSDRSDYQLSTKCKL